MDQPGFFRIKDGRVRRVAAWPFRNGRAGLFACPDMRKKARIEATVLNNLTPISKAEICKILPDVSPTTVEVVLGTMVKNNAIKIIGSGRNTKYMKK